MKKLTILFTILLSPFAFNITAQQWVKMMHDPNVNVQDVQKAFYAWYGSDEPSKELPEHESGYELFKRWENIMAPRTYPTGDRSKMNKALGEYLSDKKNATHAAALHAASWVYAGTIGIPSQPVINGGDGRISRVRFAPGNSNILYGCAPGGGLWKSTDGGNSWTTNTDQQLPVTSTTDVAIDPSNPAIMYLATGDGDGYNSYTVGIYKSVDTGKTWTVTSLNSTFQNSGQYGLEANTLLINPDSSNVVFAGMDYGLYRSRDYGTTWTMVIADDIKDVEFEPSHTNIVYASSEDGKFFRSSNGGSTYTQITNGLPDSDVARVTIGVSPADSNRVYLLFDENNESRFYGLYMSTDRGQTFTTQSSFALGAPNLLGWSPTGNDSSGQGWYTLPLAVSQTNADTILVGGVNVWMSGDKGVTWSLNAEWTGNGAPFVHADIHHIIFYPGSGSSYLVGCDGGIYKTTNMGGTWNDISGNLEIAELYSIGLSGITPGLNISGWQDNGTNLSGLPWVHTAGGDGETSFIDYTNDSNMFASTQNGGLIYSINKGANWGGAVGNITEGGAWTTPWLQDPYKPNKAYEFAGFENVWYTKDTGFHSWKKVSTWGVKGKYINHIAIYPGDDDYIYVSRGDSIFATNNKGFTWKVINSSLPLSSYSASDITVDPKNPDRIWVTLSGYGALDKVFQSENAGSTWKNISTGLPNLPMNCIICQPNTPEGIYVGTDIGVYYHDTALNAWVNFNTGLPNVSVTDLKIESPNTLVAATFGRGVWQTQTYINTSVANLAYAEIDANIYPNPTNGNIRLVMNGATEGDYTISVINMVGQVIHSEKVNVNGLFSKTLNLSGYGKGVYFIRIEGNNAQTVKKVVVL